MLGYFIFFLLLIWGGLLGFYARDLRRRWREPILRFPVVIFESDDWGAGPPDQARALVNLSERLARFKDQLGHAPVVTLGIILATADTRRMRDAGGSVYFSADVLTPHYTALRAAIEAGVRQGVFALHLHGMEHYWPPSLMQAAVKEASVRDWLQSDGIPSTESLASPLQARWTDASVLPSRALESAAIHAAVTEEASLFARCFNAQPRVGVATTFVWTEAVEAAWAKAGIDVIITPGVRYTCRDAAGKPGGADKRMFNGELSQHGQIYLVRDVYFEPALGHTAARLVKHAQAHTHLGRPCLVEMHRFNFMGAAEQCDTSLRVLEAALAQLQQTFPDLHFMSSLALAEAIRAKNPSLLEAKRIPQMRIWLRRIAHLRGFTKLAKLSGLALPLWLMGKALGA